MSGGDHVPERDPETIRLFLDESFESLGRAERLLIQAEQGEAARDLMSVLFRELHTMKGSAGFLSYDKIRRLAHAAEDLLARLRAQPAAQRPEGGSYSLFGADAGSDSPGSPCLWRRISTRRSLAWSLPIGRCGPHALR